MEEDKDFSEYEIVHSEGSSEETPADRPKPLSLWKMKLIFWGTIVGGVAIGICVLFFFITLFVYFFIPLLVLVGAWLLVRKLFR